MRDNKKQMKFQIFKTANKQWAFRIRSTNGKTLAHSESYTRKQAAVKAINRIKSDSCNAIVEHLPEP